MKAYAIAADQHDPQTVKKLVNMLMNSGVEVQQTKAQLIVEGRVYGPGSFVVSMAQPKQGLVRWMLGRTFYPDNTYTRDLEGNPIRPYDMSTDTFGEFMGVRSDPIGEKVTGDLVKLTAKVPMTGTVRGERAERLRARRPAERQLPRRVPAARQGHRGPPRCAAVADGSVKTGDFLVPARRSSRRSRSRPAWTSSRSSRRVAGRRLRTSASRASRCCSATAAATWTRAGRA